MGSKGSVLCYNTGHVETCGNVGFFNLTFICPCIASIFAEYNQQDATFLNLFISVRRSTCFRQVFRTSSGAQNCTYSVRH